MQVSQNPQNSGGRDTPERSLITAAESQNVPIRFFGKVVDQDGAPLEGVNVTGRVRHWSVGALLNLQAGFIKREDRTGPDGRFELKDATGSVLTIEALEKQGYEPEPIALRSFGYNISTNITPDPDNPIVLRMWKAEVKEELISGEKFFTVVPDGRTYMIDLVRGTLAEGTDTDGDLRVTIRRPPDAAFGQRYDWMIEIQAVGGGLLEEPDRYASMFQAPLEGYSETSRTAFDASEADWTYAVINKRFYMKTRLGRVYGRLQVDTHAFYLKDKLGRLKIKYSINPQGSRVLR